MDENIITRDSHLSNFGIIIRRERMDLTPLHYIIIRTTIDDQTGETIGLRTLSLYIRIKGTDLIRENRYFIGDTYRTMMDLPFTLTGGDFTLGGHGDFTHLGTRTWDFTNR